MNHLSTPLFGRLLAASPLSARELSTLIQSAPQRYKSHFIEKRHGRGQRLISQPTYELKFFQRFLVDTEFQGLKVHHNAVGYQKGYSIVDHAAPHALSRYLLKLDFKEFFPSLTASALRYRLEQEERYSATELWTLCQLLCRNSDQLGTLRLSIGAPSSPFVSNYLMFEFDAAISQYCSVHSIAYTRYADDLALSTSKPRVLDAARDEVCGLLARFNYLGLCLNEQKTVNVSKKRQRRLVGLTLSNSGAVSIGRDYKRRLRAGVEALTNGRLSESESQVLIGKLAFVHSVDPEFVLRLCKRYGADDLGSLKLAPHRRSGL